jgi:hypothetical protein
VIIQIGTHRVIPSVHFLVELVLTYVVHTISALPAGKTPSSAAMSAEYTSLKNHTAKQRNLMLHRH